MNLNKFSGMPRSFLRTSSESRGGDSEGTEDISFINKAVQINLPNIANGHYSYKIQFIDEVYTGNLQIKK